MCGATEIHVSNVISGKRNITVSFAKSWNMLSV